MRTDTVEIMVLDAEPLCGWCKHELWKLGSEPVDVRGRLFHSGCALAEQRDQTVLMPAVMS